MNRIKVLKLHPPVDVVCPGERTIVTHPHILRIEKIYAVNNRSFAYCREHQVFFTVDINPQEIIDYVEKENQTK